MTSGHFAQVDPKKIWVNRENRQRRELKGIPELRDSIARIGLINPPVITREFELKAGERRWTAIMELGWTSMPIQWADTLSEADAQRLELEENIKRLDIEWPEECKAVLTYHNLMLSENPAWTLHATAEALGMSDKSVAEKIGVAKELLAGNTMVAEAPKFSTARGIVQRTQERAAASEAITRLAISDPVAAEQKIEESRRIPLVLGDFNKFVEAYTGPRSFNLLHCDFPYGVNADQHDQGQAAAQGGYADSFEVYEELLHSLELAMDSLVADSAHLLFWFSMDYYEYTRTHLAAMGWAVNPFPLVWVKSDGTGILPDPNRGPRRGYETAFLASRGDRKIVRAKTNWFSHPGKDKSIHMSEKPVPMLKHFLEMLVDEYTVFLDPTCGSGNSVKAASALGAPSVLGMERDPTFYARAREAYFNE
jgi:ParB-like chromosome segregation protein Spo0J